MDFQRVTTELDFCRVQRVSILFNILTYGSGAAHPISSIKTLNFIDGKAVSLEQLFKPESDYLKTISAISYTKLANQRIEDGISPDERLKEGTSPTITNYNLWYFSKKGLVIVFEPLQFLGIENSGEAYVVIPHTKLKNYFLEALEHSIWGNTTPDLG